tara:strand:- start:9900 stop:11027 length:1128 start_codon:yes stop_codon:yes gene_type:complete
MKIVHVLPALTKGGGERVMAELANHANSVGHEVTVLAACPVDKTLLEDFLHEDIKVNFVRRNGNRKLLWYVSAIFWLWKHRLWIKSQDVVHCHMTFGAFFCTMLWYYLKLSRDRGPIVVETCHSAGAPISSRRRRFFEWMASRRDGFVLIAKDEDWERFLASKPHVLSRVILNGVADPSKERILDAESKAYRAEIGLKDSLSLIIGTVGMLRADRQPWLFVPIFEEIASECPEVEFIIAGGGPEYERMQALFAEKGILNKVHLLGTVKDSRYPLSLMDVYISLNVGPVTGLAGMEAAMAGVPIVGLQWISDYVVTEEDWIWSSQVQSEVALKVISFIKCNALRRKVASSQQQFLLEYLTVDAMANSYYKLYKEAA